VAKRIYQSKKLVLLDDTEITIKPLKIKYLHDVMETFDKMANAKTNEDSMEILIEAVYYSFQQFCPEICTDISYVEDNVTMPMINEILEVCAGITMSTDENKETVTRAKESGNSWKDLDLVRLESEIFRLGIWKDFEELEENLSMPELIEVLNAMRDAQKEDRKFLAAIQGIDLDKGSKDSSQNKWEEMKARVFSRGVTSDPNDVLSLQGQNAKKAGFGIGMGLDYDDARDPNLMKN